MSVEYFIPHHGVFKSGDTSKIRVVFNGSHKSRGNLSLNDILMTGPTIQDDIFSILTRFRKHQFAFSGDIVKMYRQIGVRDDDQNLQKIWWRYNPKDSLTAYNLKTVTYGTSCAPFLAIRTLKQLALDEAHKFPKASRILQSDFYVDDVATGANSIEEALALRNELQALLTAGCFELSKFSANFVMDGVFGDESDVIKQILGIQWNTKLDLFIITFGKLSREAVFTKRVVLSEITQIFDPIGLCAPVVFYAKHFMQKLWAELNLNWDDELPILLKKEWTEFRDDLIRNNSVVVQRCVIPANSINTTLHGFGDASEKGYGCCIYVVTTTLSGQKLANLLCAKSKVAPLRRLTIPRLELCAALLLSQLYSKVISCCNIKFDEVFLWTDSEITLYRIKSSPARYATFVGNRIAQIQELTNTDNWFHVSTNYNPADIVSRGAKPCEIQDLALWWYGPQFIIEDELFWPKQPIKISNRSDDEFKKINVVLQCEQDSSCDIFLRYSNLTTLLKTVALCYRFISNCRKKRSRQPLNNKCLEPLDFDAALMNLVKKVQHDEFSNEIKLLKAHKQIHKSSKLLKLSPFMDDKDFLRVGGRIHHSSLSYEQKHQYLLPSNHTLTDLIISHEHFKNLHAGPQALLNIIRRKFWIMNGRNICRKIVHRCVRCFRTRPIIFEQVMGQIPAERLQPSRPFLTVGVDFCGPFHASYKIRSKVTSKVYIAVFVCFCTKACHMELVHDLSTGAFIAALRRFTSRRGNPSKIFSDNATNFIGAQSELKELARIFTNQTQNHTLTQFCTSQGIHWQTIPPRSPHFGGLWEATIKKAKYHLKRVIATHKFTAEELNTIVIQVEANLNSRPITPLSADPNDLNALTPGHFLIGDSLTAPPDPNLLDLNFDRLSRWQRIQQILQRFWKLWSIGYLNELQQRTKWHSQHSITEEMMVLIKDDNLPPMKWLLGRIIKTYPGSDGFVRVVDVKTESNIFRRAVSRICVLPFEHKSN